MADIILKKVNEVYLHVDAEQSTLMEMSAHFEFFVPGYQFMPAFRNRMWDGKIRLLDMRTRQIYTGLLHHIEQFAQDRDYTIEYDSALTTAQEFSLREAEHFADGFSMPFKARDYQLKALVSAVRTGRKLLECPTASGKSLIAYLLVRYYHTHKFLIIVPTKSLVAQLYTDFDEYGKGNNWRSKNVVHYIMAGQEKQTNRRIVISTWQSLHKMPKKYFAQYDAVIGDECHLFKSKSLTSIMTKLTHASVRIGMTGTVQDAQTHVLVLEGLFGKQKKIITTKELIDQKHLAALSIKAIALKHPPAECARVARMKYHEEVEYLVSSDRRNSFITNLATSLEGNTLVLFQYVQKHGDKLYALIKKRAKKGRKVFYVFGGTDVEMRESVRAIVETEKDAIIVASNGVFSTGTNIKNLHNIIFGHPGKSKIRTLQSIGRVLRKSTTKDSATLYDIIDDLAHNKHKNFAIKHFLERHKYYVAEQFPTKIYTVELRQ